MKLKKVMTTTKEKFIPIQEWHAEPQDIIFQHSRGFIICPISRYFNYDQSTPLDYFNMSAKKAYNSEKIRAQCVHYLNYFEKFYDKEKLLYTLYARIKYFIDCETANYSKDKFFADIMNHICHGMIMIHITHMNADNYCLDIKFSGRDVNLYYNNNHVYSMLKISTTMLLIIPLLTHFAKVNKITNIDDFLLEIYQMIIDTYMDKFDLVSKLYESCSTNINRNAESNPIWEKQGIRGINQTTHAIDSIRNIILNVMPKYVYGKDQNPVMLNYASIRRNIGYKITDIGYEYDYIPLSSSNRDEDNNSEFDKFESYMIKQDESLFIQNKVNCEATMKILDQTYGPISQNEINFYVKQLSADNSNIINKFQKELIFNLFYKYFGDSTSINAINRDDYIKLMIIGKNMLMDSDMFFLPWIISGRVNKLFERKSLNKNERIKMEDSPLYAALKKKYMNPKLDAKVERYIATILSSEFIIIDDSGELNGQPLVLLYEYIIEEVLRYSLMI